MIRRRSRGTIAMLDSSAGLTLLGVPLQQQWSCANSGAFAPTYDLRGDAPLYSCSFTDAHLRERPETHRAPRRIFNEGRSVRGWERTNAKLNAS